MQTWGGTIAAASETDRFTLVDVDQGQIRLPDGHEGDFIASYSDVKSSSAGVSTYIEITGSGEAPF